MKRLLILFSALTASGLARDVREASADAIPIITITDVGPDQEIPTDRSFYVRGDAPDHVQHVQAVVVRRGSPSMFGDDGPTCHDLIAELNLDSTLSGGGDDEDSDDDSDVVIPVPRFDAGMHRAFEMFPNAEGAARTADVMISAAWQRMSDEERAFNVLVPHDTRFFSAGYGYCLVVVTTEHAQEIDDATLTELVNGVASKIVACGDKASCDDEALAEYEVRVARALANAGTVKRAPGRLGDLASLVKEAARVELGHATGLVEQLGHMSDRFYDKINVMPPVTGVVWAPTATDPFAQAVANLLTHAGTLLPQVRGNTVSLFTSDGKLQVRHVQLLDDGRTIRVASSKAPSGAQARVLTTTTDSLMITDTLTLYDLIQLGNRQIRVEKDWISLKELGDGVAQLGLEQWTAEDTAFLVAATAQMKRLADFVDLATSGHTCTKHKYPTTETEQTLDAVRRQLGDWLVCQKVDAAAIETMREHLAALVAEDQAWNATKAKLVAKSRRIVTLTSTAPTNLRVSFAARTWIFSYVTPIAGYAGVLRPDESFGLFYLGAQIHLDPNPVGDVQWRHGVTTKDLRRSIALELGVAPYRASFGPDMRFGGPGSLPPIFVGAAVHVLPYTSVTFGGAFVDRRNSTLVEERPHTVFAPYLGFTVQLNVPDLIRQTAGPSTDTAASR